MDMTAASPLAIPGRRTSCPTCSLRGQCLPGRLDAAATLLLDAVIQRPAPLRRGQSLYRINQPARSLYVVRSGAVRTMVPDGEAGMQVTGFHLRGELAGLDALAGERHSAMADALERTSVCAIPLAALERLTTRMPELQVQLHRLLSREIALDHAHMRQMTVRTARGKLARFLYELATRYARAGMPPDEIQLPMSRADIASYLGLAVETASRQMRGLADDGIIDANHRSVRIIDRPRLAALAGETPVTDPLAYARLPA